MNCCGNADGVQLLAWMGKIPMQSAPMAVFPFESSNAKSLSEIWYISFTLLLNCSPYQKELMKIVETIIYKLSIPMHPFTIATGTMDFAQNTLVRIVTNEGIEGWGECSAFPMIVGETQNTCYEMAKAFAALWKGKEAIPIEERMNELHAFTAFNSTIKSAFEMALFDLAAKDAKLP